MAGGDEFAFERGDDRIARGYFTGGCAGSAELGSAVRRAGIFIVERGDGIVSALLFLLEQTERVITTFFRENLKAREMGVYIRFKDFTGNGRSVRFPGAQFLPREILPVVEKLFHQIVMSEIQPIRQVCINFWNMQPLELEPDLFGFNQDLKHRQLHRALEQIETLYGKNRIKTGTRVLLEQEAKHLVRDKAKCPFIPQREMEVKMNRVPEEVKELVYGDDWKPLEDS